MPLYIVTETREYDERWLIEASSLEEAKQLGGTIIDHDDGSGSDTGQEISVVEVDDGQDEL